MPSSIMGKGKAMSKPTTENYPKTSGKPWLDTLHWGRAVEASILNGFGKVCRFDFL